MTIIGALIVLVIIGVGLAFVPIDAKIRNIIIALIALVVFVWLLSYFGIWHGPHLR